MEKQRRHMIQLVSNAFLKTDADGGGTLDETELPEMLGLLEQWSDMLDHVGLSAEAMQRACLIADYSHEGRSHWQHTDEHGNVSHKVYHDKLRPAPSKGTRGFKRVLSTEEGVMEAEIVQTLIDMDQGTTRAEFFEIMKAFRLFNKKKTQQIEEMDHGLNQRMREAMRLCGGDSGWKPPPMPCKQVIDEDDREEPGNEEKYAAGKESKLNNGEKLSKNDDGLGKKQGMPQQGNETGAGAKPAMEALPVRTPVADKCMQQGAERCEHPGHHRLLLSHPGHHRLLLSECIQGTTGSSYLIQGTTGSSYLIQGTTGSSYLSATLSAGNFYG